MSIRVADEPYWKSVELGDSLVLDLSRDGQVIGLEVFQARTVLADDFDHILKLCMA